MRFIDGKPVEDNETIIEENAASRWADDDRVLDYRGHAAYDHSADGGFSSGASPT